MFEKTRVPGVYVRSGSYYASVTVRGQTRRVRAGKTIGEAVRLKRRLEADRDKGVEIAALREREVFVDYAREWVAGYSGRGTHHVSDRTKMEYARDLEKWAFPWFQQTRLGHIRPKTIDEFIAYLQAETDLADATIRRVLAPVKACLATAAARGDTAGNPAVGCRVRDRPQIVEHEDERVKALSRQQLADLIAATDPRWRLLVVFLAGTGLRSSEALGLRWKDVDLGNEPAVRVVRAVKHGQGERMGPRSRRRPGAGCPCPCRWP